MCGLALAAGHSATKYAKACSAEVIVFIPLPVETTGGWEEDAAAVIKRLGQALARTTCQQEAEAVRHLFGKLSILLMKTNASMILNRVPRHPDSSTSGVL